MCIFLTTNNNHILIFYYTFCDKNNKKKAFDKNDKQNCLNIVAYKSNLVKKMYLFTISIHTICILVTLNIVKL